MSVFADTKIETIKRLEELAAWHRAVAERAGSAWVWEARLLAAEDLERQAADARARLESGELDIGSRDALRAETDYAMPQSSYRLHQRPIGGDGRCDRRKNRG